MELRNRIICIVGPKGTGKTERASRMFGSSDRALVFNVAFDRAYYPRATHIVTDDVIGAGEIMRTAKTYRIVFETENMAETKSGRMIYPDIDALIRECYMRGPMTMFVDEAHMVASSQSASFETKRMALIGRHHNLSAVYITQRVNGVHPDIRSNADEYHIFHVIEPLDIQVIASRCGWDTAAKVQSLRRLSFDNGKVLPGECLIWSADGQERIE